MGSPKNEKFETLANFGQNDGQTWPNFGQILKEVKTGEKNSCITNNPATAAVCEIFRYCKKNEIDITLTTLSEISGISMSTLRTNLKKK